MNKEEKLLKETIEYYNSNNRATVNIKNCTYYDSKTGNKCAIGRLMLNPKKYESTYTSVTNLLEYYPNLLKEYPFNTFSILFLNWLQCLHDKSEYWNANGITQSGLGAVQYICDVFKLNYNLVVKDIS